MQWLDEDALRGEIWTSEVVERQLGSVIGLHAVRGAMGSMASLRKAVCSKDTAPETSRVSEIHSEVLDARDANCVD